MSIVGRTYLEKGQPVKVLVQWRKPPPGMFCAVHFSWLCGMGQGECRPGRKSGPRNVLIERADGTRTVRPFRGLRRVADETGDEA